MGDIQKRSGLTLQRKGSPPSFVLKTPTRSSQSPDLRRSKRALTLNFKLPHKATREDIQRSKNKPPIPPLSLELAFKSHRRYINKPRNLYKDDINHEQFGSSVKIGSAHRSSNGSPLCSSPSAVDLTAAQHNYAERMKRIKRQTEEMVELGLISVREEAKLRKCDWEASPRPTRVNAVDFWGYKTKLRLIKQLGYTEAYRDFNVKKSFHLNEGSHLHLSSSSSPLHQVSTSLLRSSCPVSPSFSDQQPQLLKLRQVPNTHNVNALVQEAKRLDVLEKIIGDCDQFKIGRVQRKRVPSNDD